MTYYFLPVPTLPPEIVSIMSSLEQPIQLIDPARRRHQIISGVIYFVVAAFAIFVVLPRFLVRDETQLWPLLRTARYEWLALAVLCECVRYFSFGLVTRQLAGLLGLRLTRSESAQMMVGSHAVNRLIPSGGVIGFAVRFQFFAKHQFSFGRTLGLLVTQNVVSGAVLLCTFIIGMSLMGARGLLTSWMLLVAVAWLCVVSGVALTQVWLGLHPRRLERVVSWWLQRVERGLSGVLKRALYQPMALQKFLGDFSQSVHTTIGQPRGLLVAGGYQALAVAANIASLMMVFNALQVPYHVGMVVGGYIVAYYVQLAIPNPGEAGSFEATLSSTLIFLGVEPVQALAVTLLFRFMSYWLPIPAGLLSYFNLKRQGKV